MTEQIDVLFDDGVTLIRWRPARYRSEEWVNGQLRRDAPGPDHARRWADERTTDG